MPPKKDINSAKLPYSCQFETIGLHSSTDMKYTSRILFLTLCVAFQSACSNQAAYVGESFSNDSPFKLKTDRDTAQACESVRRALLGQGYLIDLASSEEVKARKATRGEGKQNAFIEMNAACVPDSNGSTVFATGVLSNYAMKMSSSSASVGVAAIGSISLPIGQSVDSLVKVSEETIDDTAFYKRFFSAVETILGEIEADKPAEDIAEEVAEPEPTSQAMAQPAIWPELFPEPADTLEAPADVEPASQPVTQPTILPEFFPGSAAAEVPPVPVQVAPETTFEASPTQAVPETVSQTPSAPEIAPQPPVQTESEIIPVVYQEQAEPGATPQSSPSPELPASASAPFQVQLNQAPEPVGTPELGQPTVSVIDDEEPMGISAEPMPAQGPVGLPAVSQLAPIQPTSVARKPVPIAVQKALDAAAAAAPAVAPSAPPPAVEDLF
jgi:hypothetical protein